MKGKSPSLKVLGTPNIIKLESRDSKFTLEMFRPIGALIHFTILPFEDLQLLWKNMQSNFVKKAYLNSRRKQANEKTVKGQTGRSLGNTLL